GLALAHELAPDHHVTVLESSPGPRGGGSMIDFFGPGFVAAERLGVIEELRSRGHGFEGVRYGTPAGTETGRIDAGPLRDAAGGPSVSIPRAGVEPGRLAAVPGNGGLRYGARAVGVRAAAPQRAAVALGPVGELDRSDGRLRRGALAVPRAR